MENCVDVKLFRIPGCSLCDKMEKNLKEFKPTVYDCSKRKNKTIMVIMKRLSGRWFGYPMIVIQCEDLMLMISGYYSDMMKDIKNTIRELRRSD